MYILNLLPKYLLMFEWKMLQTTYWEDFYKIPLKSIIWLGWVEFENWDYLMFTAAFSKLLNSFLFFKQ